ncbi:OmpA family protein [uncultured Muriicola sp.]|uniref:OmpA family protein n=1 Tax=uncultured Muriicola sp. TaxID=1583102 RepID=UPI002605A62A|nr:OmpA family protein [uncultured Muriicola sp.]
MVSLSSAEADAPDDLADTPLKRETLSLNTTHLFQHVLFDFDEYELVEGAKAYLKETYDFLASDPSLHIVIHGHTDGVGTIPYNLRLSNSRCKAVASYFVELGLPKERVSWKGHGGSLPIALNSTPEGRRQNRRVEFILTKIE